MHITVPFRILFSLLLVFAVGACVLAFPAGQAHAESATTTTVTIGSKNFKMKLASGKPAQAFRAYLSRARSFKMSELNGNEKYRYFSGKMFPTGAKRYQKVKAGDVMLYGDDCLVIFYKTHKSSYRYTKIGRLASVKGLAKAAGKKAVKVRFAKMKQYKGKGGAEIEAPTAPSAHPIPSTPAAGNGKSAEMTSAGGGAEIPNDAANPAREAPGDSSSVAPDAGLAEPEPAREARPEPDSMPAGPSADPSDLDSPQPDAVSQAAAGKLVLTVNDCEVKVSFAENDAVSALATMAAGGPVTVTTHAYGGFEQVGPLPSRLPASDMRITTLPGDIVLYQGNQICAFYGSNTWSYTPIGHIEGLSDAELADLLSSGGATLVFSTTR